jgi:minor extracellular serine protease Vpr
VKRVLVVCAAMVLAACGGGGGGSDSASVGQPGLVGAPAPGVAVDGLAFEGQSAQIDQRLLKAQGKVEVWVRLTQPSAAAQSVMSKTGGVTALSKQDIGRHVEAVKAAQQKVGDQLASAGATELGRVGTAHNAIAVSVDAAQLAAISKMPGVARITPVLTYELDLSETVPYIGAASAQATGKDGTGVRVAVIDSGIDYTHRNLGGEGTAAAYAAAYGANTADPKNTTLDGLFPTAKVVGGFDFVGEQWPNGDRTEDPDPIDLEGHGTHVADIIAGQSRDGLHKGVAPGAKLYAVKACSAVASSCNGVALLKAMDFSLDPNGDGDVSDHVDVINMSLGSAYGQQEDDLSEAAAEAVRVGVIVVASAGNNGDRPFITGSPAAAQGVLSVAQTAVPGAKAFPLIVNSPAAIAGTYGNTATVEWAPIASGFTGNVSFVGRGCPAVAATATTPAVPADPYLDNPAGKVALIDRGSCGISLKVERAAQAGAIGVIVGLVAAGDAVSFSNAGGAVFVPTIVIQQTLSNAIKANLAAPVNVTVSASNAIGLAGSLASTSSRGPNVSATLIKPEIGAPGASISAIAGSGNGEEAFGGTSGAAPMVAGAAAILRQAYPDRSVSEIKALLMNSAETKVFTNPALLPGVLAPITRIGAGEVRVDRALKLNAAAWSQYNEWDPYSASSSLSFGYVAVTDKANLVRRLTLKNYSDQPRVFSVEVGFRYADDQTNGAVSVEAPSSVWVAAGGVETINFRMKIDGSKLPSWVLNGGNRGGDGPLLQLNEYDGYVTIKEGTDTVTVPWHVLPRKAADVRLNDTTAPPCGSLALRNSGIENGVAEQFALTGVSPRFWESQLPLPGDNFALIDIRAVGVRLAAPGILQFGINTWGTRTHPNYPAKFDVLIDSNSDGTPDYVVFTGESGTFGSSGTNVVNVRNLATSAQSAFFFTDADLQSGNVIMTVPLSAIGLTEGTKFNFSVEAYDNYFTGNKTDEIGTMTFTPNLPRYFASGVPASIPGNGGTANLTVNEVAGGAAASPSQTGVLFLYRSQREGREAQVVRVR